MSLFSLDISPRNIDKIINVTADSPESSAPVSSCAPGRNLNSHRSCRSTYLTALLFILLLTLGACGPSTETIVVGDQARTIESEEEEEEDTGINEDRRVLKIGEINRIRSFDPLFAVNTATKRTILLLYEGLVGFNENDEVVPAAARRWEVSDDSLTYTFTLRRDLYFHDDESFTQGRGRRMNSRDVVRVFERMASRDVPSDAADLFMNEIRGFETFYLEQREIYFSGDREITNISGIETGNDSTIVFHLLENSRDFLKKLASPYAVLYPSEPFRFRDNGLHRHAVGTGPFAFERSIGDSIHIFNRNNTYYGENARGRRLPRIDRIELLNITDETRLNDQFTRGHLDMIVNLGPRGVHTFIDSTNRLKEEFRGTYHLVSRSNPDPVILQYNSRNRFDLNRPDAAAVIRNVTLENIRQDLNFPSLHITYKDEDFSQTNVARVYNSFGEIHQNRLLFAYHQDRLSRYLSEYIHQTMDDNLRIDMMQRRIFSRDLFLYLDYLTTYVPGKLHDRQPQELLRFETDRYMVINNNTEGVRTNNVSWWIDFKHVRTPETTVSDPGTASR